MKIAVVCCSLNPDSRSSALAEHLRAPFDNAGVTTDWIALRDHPLPLCDGGAAYADPVVGDVAARLAAADAVVLALPIYNYGVNAAAKNLIELAGRGLTGKPVGLVCSAGGRASYMSVMGFAAGLMLDFRCWIVPRFVFAHDADFTEPEHPHHANEALQLRLHELAVETHRAAVGLAPAPAPAPVPEVLEAEIDQAG